MPTFCWFPPDSRRTSDCTRVSICRRLAAASTRRFSARGLIGPHLETRLTRGSAMFSRTDL